MSQRQPMLSAINDPGRFTSTRRGGPGKSGKAAPQGSMNNPSQHQPVLRSHGTGVAALPAEVPTKTVNERG